MPCYTVLSLENLEDTAVNREARRRLGLPETGSLAASLADRVRVEAGLLRATSAIRRLNPTAVIRRQGDKLQVSVNL